MSGSWAKPSLTAHLISIVANTRLLCSIQPARAPTSNENGSPFRTWTDGNRTEPLELASVGSRKEFVRKLITERSAFTANPKWPSVEGGIRLKEVRAAPNSLAKTRKF